MRARCQAAVQRHSLHGSDTREEEIRCFPGFGVGSSLFLWFPLGSTFVFAQENSRTEALALEQQGQNAEAEQVWKSIAEANPENPEAFAHLGLLEARQENYAAAIENYRKALKLAPSMPGLEMNLGLAYFKANQFPDAIKVFSAELQEAAPEQSRRHSG